MSDKKNDKINAELDDMIDELIAKGRKKAPPRRGNLTLVTDDDDESDESYESADGDSEAYADEYPDEKSARKAEKRARKEEKKARKKGKGRNRKGDEIELAEGYELGLPPFTRFIIRFFIFIIIVGGLAAFAWYKCRIVKFEVVGNTWYTADEISDALRTETYDDFSFGLKLHYMFADTPEMPFINSFKIKMTSLDSIKVTVYEKKIVGCVKVQSDYMFFDKDGIVVASRSENVNKIPVVTGLGYTQAMIGKKLEVENDRVFATILAITQLIDKNKVPVDSLDFDEDFNVTLIASDGNRFYLGQNQKYDEIFGHVVKLIPELEASGHNYWADYSTFTGDEDYFLGKIIDNN